VRQACAWQKSNRNFFQSWIDNPPKNQDPIKRLASHEADETIHRLETIAHKIKVTRNQGNEQATLLRQNEIARWLASIPLLSRPTTFFQENPRPVLDLRVKSGGEEGQV
jgi:hypothetical protein